MCVVCQQIKVLTEIAKKVDKTGKPPVFATKVLQMYQLALLNNWVTLAKPLIAKADKVSHTDKAINAFIAEINSTMAKFPALVSSEITNYTDYLYKYSKVQFIESHGYVKKAKLPKIEPSIWLEKDAQAIELLDDITSRSVNGFYSGSVQTVVAESVKKNIFESNLSTKQAAQAMKKDLTKALKLQSGQLTSKVVPPGFIGTADEYFQGLTNHIASMGRTAGSLFTMEDVGVKTIGIYSTRSSRTCEGCAAMDGTTYTIESASTHMSKLLQAQDKDELNDIQPSFHFGKAGTSSESKLDEAKALAEMGVQVPPFHFRCECYVDSI